MKFILNLTRREIRSSWRRLLFFFLCIALGVGSIVFLRSLIQNLTRVVGNDARALMTADVEVSSTNEFSPAQLAAIDEAVGRSGIVDGRDETISASAMARPSDPKIETIELVELKGIEPSFPLVGTFTLSTGDPFDQKLLSSNGAVIARPLLDDLKIRVGDSIKIGQSQFQVRGTFDEEPGGSSGFRLGPRVFVQKGAFDAAGITQNASRVRRRLLFRTTENPVKLVADLRQAVKGSTIQVNSYREQQENMSEQFDKTENYLSLTGLLILVLGGVGVWNVARAFIEQKRKTVAVLKCLGASGGRIMTVYLLQILTLGLIGSLFGVVLAQVGLVLAGWRFGDALPAKLSYVIDRSASWQGVVLGIFISILFSVLPLMQIRDIKPRLLLRDENNTNLSRLDLTRWVFALVCIAALLGLAIWQAGSLKVGAFFLGGLAATGAVLFLTAAAAIFVLRRLRSFGTFSFRQAVNSLYRPGNQTRVILLAVGLGAFVVLTVQTVQTNLAREFDITRNQRLPSLIFVDVQKSQIDELTRVITEATGEAPQNVPTVRARISYVNGKPIDYDQKEVRQNQGQIGREFALTYRPELEENETIVSGHWWNRDDDIPEVSVQEQLARTLNVSPGDSITFDISGRLITAEVSSIRRIDVRKARTAFAFVLEPGVLENAPQSYASTVIRHVPETERLRLQRKVLEQFPNVQIFDVDDILVTVRKLIGNFVLAISFVGGFVLLSGVLILIGSVALTKSQRIYENAILKTLGATRRTLIAILFTEYGLVGVLSGLIATAFATGLSFLVCRYLINIDWEVNWLLIAGGTVATALIVTVVGVAASFDVLFRKPMLTLRSQ